MNNLAYCAAGFMFIGIILLGFGSVEGILGNEATASLFMIGFMGSLLTSLLCILAMGVKLYNTRPRKGRKIHKPGQRYVTMGWDFRPITTKGDGKILPRSAEYILNRKYYPTGIPGEWPIDPETGEKLEIEEH